MDNVSEGKPVRKRGILIGAAVGAFATVGACVVCAVVINAPFAGDDAEAAGPSGSEPEDQGPTPTVIEAAVYTTAFAGGQLDTCTEWLMRAEALPGTAEEDIASIRERVEHASATPLEAVEQDDSVSKIGKPCGQAFKGRTVLASCVMEQSGDGLPGGASGYMAVRTHYYNFATAGESDRPMKDCLDQGGDFEALDRDSREWRRARREAAMGDAKRALKDLEEMGL